MQVKAYDNFRENVKAVMEDRGISVRELARLASTSHPYISRMLNGHHVPSLDKCDQIADLLGISLHNLLREEKSSKRQHS